MIASLLAAFWQGLPVALGLLASSHAAASAAAPPRQLDCFARPSRCGYPDATNTGVPPGTALTRSGSIVVDEDGERLSGLDLRGTVVVDADHVTIAASRIVAPRGGAGSHAILLEQGADDFSLEDSEVSGPRHGPGLESAVWNHYDNPGASATRAHLHHCADCWEGAGTFRRSYLVVNSSYPGSHDENVYVCGATVRVRRSTLINRHTQTATVFGDTAGCGPNHVAVTDSLLAGGGYLLYPQANSDGARGTMTIARNHFARCRTATVYEPASGGRACAGGPDRQGIFPGGGYFGVAAAYYLGAGQVWRENVWDDNGRPVCPTGTCPRGGPR